MVMETGNGNGMVMAIVIVKLLETFSLGAQLIATYKSV